MVLIGREIPDFELESFYKNDFHKIRLSEYRGRWLVMLFYPADFTFVCPTELSAAADYYDRFQAINAEIVSISTDTAYVHKAWHDESKAIHKITFPMLADPTGQVCRAFGTYLEDEGLSLRASLIIDPEGRLRAMDIHDNSIGRSIEEIYRKLQASQYVHEHAGEVCPASWKPGDKTLKPDIALVGKI
ncbi:MAG: peroxiredoxin [Patescibacteria group bacterium]